MTRTKSKPDPADFDIDVQPTRYTITFRVEGEINMTVKAENESAARDAAEAIMDSDDFGVELDTVDDIGVAHVRKFPTMYLVTRNGRDMQVSHLCEGDLPRSAPVAS